MQRLGWVWDALPAHSHRITCLGGGHGLANALSESGFEVTTGESGHQDHTPADAVLAGEADSETARKAAQRAAATTTGVVAVPVGRSASPPVRTVPRPVRALQLIGSPVNAISAELAARRLARELRRHGLEVSKVTTGDRSLPRYGLGSGGWLKRRRLPGGAIVIGATGRRPPSVVDEIIAQAVRELKRPFKRLSADVFPSGKLAVQLADAGDERYFLSITAGDAGPGLSRSETATRAILEANPPSSLSDRIVEPLMSGSIGPVQYVLEPMAVGRHPVWVTAGLWEECLEFLVALHQLPRRASGLALAPSWPDLTTAAEILSRHADRDDRALLERIRSDISSRVSGLGVGGGHGDFFTQNLLVRGSHLVAVLDWEWAAGDALPLLDLMDLRAQLGLRRRRGLRVGQNFTDVLWPLAQSGGDGPMKAYCHATGVPADRGTLEGLAMAHWMLRAARLGSINVRRLEDPGWWDRNVRAGMVTARDSMRGSAPR